MKYGRCGLKPQAWAHNDLLAIVFCNVDHPLYYIIRGVNIIEDK